MAIAENRFQLRMVEAQEERERVLPTVWLALAATAFGLLAGLPLTILIAVALWEHSPVIALAVLTSICSLAANLLQTRAVCRLAKSNRHCLCQFTSLGGLGETWAHYLLADWIPLTHALNSINRGMGLSDLYPFVIPPKVIEKLRFIHLVINAVLSS